MTKQVKSKRHALSKVEGAKAKSGSNGRLRVQYVPIGLLKPWKKNPRKNDELEIGVIEKQGYAASGN